jgi:hypothetical protein
MSLCLVTIFKNESHIMKEWVEHYLRQGLDKFYMIDNDSNDNYIEILQPYIDNNIVECVKDAKKHAQAELYNTYFLEKSKFYDWAMVCDLDEFIYARKGFQTIKEYLNTVSDSVSQVFIPWKLFGSNGHQEQPTSVIQSFTNRTNYDKVDGFQGVLREGQELYSFTKSIVRTRHLEVLWIHNQQTSDRNYITSDNQYNRVHSNNCYSKISEEILKQSHLHCNHYAIQSYNWFMNIKSKRGDVNCDNYDFYRNEKYFHEYDVVSNDIFDNELCQLTLLKGLREQ